ncbi:hypothetical protein Cni_G05453 [Canna indica]|uniref:Protein FAR1-RELATED SEQUENCE n=1 Tax=Canna indica TaxID=4628 RepID=A0AAQ3JXS8_9LILI|nr:hypothetical protein Cni_G05453 [Canna indica]
MGIEFTEQITHFISSMRLFYMRTHGGTSRIKSVMYDCQNLEIKDSCHKFETIGILCKHALKVLDVVNLNAIPNRYILRRWTKDAKNRVINENKSALDGNGNNSTYVSEMTSVSNGMKRANEIIMRAKSYEETRRIFYEFLDSVGENIDAWLKNMNLHDSTTCDDLIANEVEPQIKNLSKRNPLHVKSKGITDAHKRHWDNKKKTKKIRSSKLK